MSGTITDSNSPISCWEAITRLPRNSGEGSHAGLLLSRYLPVWTEKLDIDTVDGPTAKKTLLKDAIAASQNARDLYEYAFNRWHDQIQADRHCTLYVKNRMIVGLGGISVLETGITLHHTFGTPLIPGSALKGLASHYCHHVWGEKDAEFKAFGIESEDENGQKFERQGQYHRLLFGTNEHSHTDKEHAGYIIFHNALMHPESLASKHPLDIDVMTPHHSDYYSAKDDKTAPTDYDNPNPITFLSVPGRYFDKDCKQVPNVGKFLIAVSCVIDDVDARRDWAGLAMDLLCQSLEYWGIGGKTSSGYGRLVDEQKVETIEIKGPISGPVPDRPAPWKSDRKGDRQRVTDEDNRSAEERIKETKRKMKNKGFRF